MIPVGGAFVRDVLPVRPPDSHKGDYGKAFLLCGSVGFVGAARLVAETCVRSGVGLVCLGVPQSVYPIVASACAAEVMCLPLHDDENGLLDGGALSAIQEKLQWCDAALIGPGLGRSQALSNLVTLLVSACDRPLVLDADGLNALSRHILVQRTSPLVLTPHDGEYARLFGSPVGQNRESAALALASVTRAITVLKGHVTLTAQPGGCVYGNTTGNPGMAKGGCGDMLAGLMTGLMAQKAAAPARWSHVDWAKLAACAVYWHGLAGDLCEQALGAYAMTPSDMISCLSKAMRTHIL